jgi:transposase-like protein
MGKRGRKPSDSTPSKLAARQLAEHGGTAAEAGRAHGVTRQAVLYAWRMLFGDRPLPGALAPGIRDAKLAALVAQGATTRQVSRELEICARTVYKVRRALGLEIARRDPATLRKLNAAVDAVLAGATAVEAAIAQGVSRPRVLRQLKARGGSVPRGRHHSPVDGRVARAVDRVQRGETVTAACLAERCAGPGVYAALKRERERGRS